MIKADSKRNIIEVQYNQLSAETFEALVMEFVVRDGTDYGEAEVSLEQKTAQVKKQIQSGKAIIVFDESTQTCNIVPKADILGKQR